MDGVLVDGEPLHFRAINELLGREGRGITLEQYKPYMGTTAGWAEFIPAFGLTGKLADYRADYNEMILKQYREHAVPLPGAVAAVEGLARAGIPVGLASSSKRPWVDACLSRIGLGETFLSMATGDEVNAGKPAPDIYQLAASRLGVRPERCLAIEDSPAGILAAKAAGMTCWAVRTEYTRGIELPGPDRELGSLLEMDIREFAEVAV